MKATIVRQEITTLILDEKEKDWLKSLTQNPIKVDGIYESDSDSKMRLDLFSVLGGTIFRKATDSDLE